MGFGFEGGDGVDEARDGEGIADTAGTADEMQGAFFAGHADGNANEGGDTGAIDLRDAVQDDHNFVNAAPNDGVEGLMQLLGGFADGQAPVHVDDRNIALVADADFHGIVVVSHVCVSFRSNLQKTLPSPADAAFARDARAVQGLEAHYTMAGMLDKITRKVFYVRGTGRDPRCELDFGGGERPEAIPQALKRVGSQARNVGV